MKPKESHTSSLTHPESVVSRFCSSFLEAGWIAAAVLSALFINIYTYWMFEPDKVALIRSIAILMFVAWLIKTIEYRVLAKPSIPSERSQEVRLKYGWLKYSVLLLAGLYFFSYLISSLTSVLPSTSFWGSYKWRQGLYTTIGYFVIFILAATHLRTRAQIERLITAIILASLPVMVYGLIQKLGWDPVSWGRDPTKRIFSTLGNPIFFAAYLIMVVPLVLARLLQLRTYPTSGGHLRGRICAGLGYSLILLLQVVSIILTQSRGPLLGLISGLAFFFFIYGLLYKKRVLVWGLVSGLILGTMFVIIFNLPNTPLEPLKKVPYLERLGRLNPAEGSARTRIINWGNALKLMRETYQPTLPHPEVIDAHPWRFILGYGPETFGNISFRHYTKEKTEVEGRNVVMDNCHNSLFQTLVTQGIFGLIAFLCLISGAIYLGLKTLKSISDGLRILLLGLISAIVAHFVESLFGLGTAVIYTHFWLFLAILYYFNQQEQVPVIPCGTKEVSNGTKKGQFLTSTLFWTYVGVSIFVITVVMRGPHFHNIKGYIIGTYLWILVGVLLGAISLYFNVPQRTNVPGVSSAFNVVGYLCLIIVAFFLIVYSNFNPILADGYYKVSFSAKNRAEKIHKDYHQHDGARRRLLEKKRRVGLLPDEEKQLQSTTEQMQEMSSLLFRLRLDSIASYQQALRLTPNEKTYLYDMGRGFIKLAKIWRAVKHSGLSIRDGRGNPMDMNVPGQLSSPPSIKEIMGFSADRYYKFNEYDFFYCGFTAMRRTYELEPTNYERRLAMAQVYRDWAELTRLDGKVKESDEYFKKAMEYYRKAQEASPNHPLVNELIKTLLKEMRKVR